MSYRYVNYLIFFSLVNFCVAQGALPIYSDYLSDNVYLLHPTAAGVGNCAKIRLTHRQQWNDIPNAPSFQSLSFHSKMTESTAIGAIIFNDNNGFHSQKGAHLSYSYHLNFGREQAMNQFTFGLSFVYLQNSINKTSFTSPIPDPVNSQQFESNNYYNFDFGLAYHYMDSYAYLTIKNMLLESNSKVGLQSLNLRRHLLTLGHYFGRENKTQFEPSIMTQYIEGSNSFFIDLNFKVYRLLENEKQIWAVISYRHGLSDNSLEGLKQLTPILGLNYKRYMISYTYTNQLNKVVLNNNGFHQFTLGVNLFCKKPRPRGCPNVNSLF